MEVTTVTFKLFNQAAANQGGIIALNNIYSPIDLKVTHHAGKYVFPLGLSRTKSPIEAKRNI